MRNRAHVMTGQPLLEEIDLGDVEQRAHAVSGALSTLDLVDIEPSEFWAVFSSAGLKSTNMDWLENALRKLQAIKAAA
jgi:hypothetical protein